MFLSAHQPVYLPWLGLFHKIAVADLFVIYDDVPYSRKMWYNRNVIAGANGPVRLSVPVLRDSDEQTSHRDVRIDNSRDWRQKHWKSIEFAYKKAPFFEQYSPGLREIYDSEWTHLAALNDALLLVLLLYLKIETPIEWASPHGLEGAKSARILDMCRKLDAGTYLFGELGREYADVEAFLAAGVVPLFQNYSSPRYERPGMKATEESLSVLDLIFLRGPQSKDILMSGNSTQNDYLVDAKRLETEWLSDHNNALG